MSCCGQQRDALAAGAHSTTAPAQPQARPNVVPHLPTQATRTPEPPPEQNLMITLRYRNRSGITVRGQHTGKRYQFTGEGSMQAVHRLDADAMIETGWFDRIWG